MTGRQCLSSEAAAMMGQAGGESHSSVRKALSGDWVFDDIAILAGLVAKKVQS